MDKKISSSVLKSILDLIRIIPVSNRHDGNWEPYHAYLQIEGL